MNASSSANSSAKYTVFFSHKVEDKFVTKSLMELLDRNTENVDYFVSENIEKGIPWRQAIAQRLTACSFLVLVFTDPKEDWGWCLYETGLFDGLSRISDWNRVPHLLLAPCDERTSVADRRPAKCSGNCRACRTVAQGAV